MPNGGYRFIPWLRNIRLESVRGFGMIEQCLKNAGQSLAAFCACELRSSEPFTEAGFRNFNETYPAFSSRGVLFLAASIQLLATTEGLKVDSLDKARI